MARSNAVLSDKGGVVATGFSPRPLQQEIFDKLNRFNVIVCHRRFGKTVLAVNILINEALRSDKKLPQFAYIAPNFGQAKRVAWNMLKDYTKDIPGVEYNEAELRVDFPHNKARIMLLSAEKPDSLRGIYLDVACLDEYGDMDPVIWREVVRPTLSDRNGRAIFIGTVKGRNNFWELYEYSMSSGDPEWYGALYRASETGVVRKHELDSARRTMTETEYESEYECNPDSGNVGAIFGREIGKITLAGEIKDVPYDPTFEVDMGFDLGINDVTAVWFFQSVRGHFRFIDYYEASGLSIPEIAHDIRLRGYWLGRTILPHDSNRKDVNSGRTTTQVLYSEGFKKIEVIPRVKMKRTSINAAKMLIPKCSFDQTKCEVGIKALRQYKREWDEKRQTFKDAPLHNWASNAADAFQQIAMARGVNSSLSDHDMQESSGPLMEAVTEYNPYEA